MMPLDLLVLGVLLLHWLLISTFMPWWGGHTFGPRLFTDMLPYLLYFLSYFVQRFPTLTRPHQLTLAFPFALCLLISFFIHARGASDFATWLWNTTPNDVNAAPARLWKWRELQFLRGL